MSTTLTLYTELAGEGVEYSWGVFKWIFWKIPLYHRNGMVHFSCNGNDCLRTIEKYASNIINIRKFSQRTRHCTLVYYVIEQQRKQNKSSIENAFLNDDDLLKKNDSNIKRLILI